MAKSKDYKQMTVEEFIQTKLFKEHLEDVLNDLLHGYNELNREAAAVGMEMKRAPLIKLVQEGLLDNTTKFLQEYYKVLSKSLSTRPSGERKTIREIGDEALHNALNSLNEKKHGKES
jgi:hypothetical protein